jgi:hypothetical protein
MKNWFTYSILSYAILTWVLVYFTLSLWIGVGIFVCDIILCYLVRTGYIQPGFVYTAKLIKFFHSEGL